MTSNISKEAIARTLKHLELWESGASPPYPLHDAEGIYDNSPKSAQQVRELGALVDEIYKSARYNQIMGDESDVLSGIVALIEAARGE